MKRLFSNKIFLLILATLLIVAIIIFDSIPEKPLQKVVEPIGVVMDPIQHFFGGVGERVSGFFSAISDGMKMKEENEELKRQIAQLQMDLQQSEEGALRWEELKDAFHIMDKFQSYDFYGTSILTRGSDEWFSVIRVDAGRNAGIQMNEGQSLPVVDIYQHLVGRVSSIGNDYAKVVPLLHEGFSVSAKIDKINGAVVRVHGEALLKKEGLCKVDSIPADAQIQVGDVLITSGEGGLFPQGILIGEIVSVEKESELSGYAILKPYVNMEELRDLFIMVEKDPDAEANTDNGQNDDLSNDTQSSD